MTQAEMLRSAMLRKKLVKPNGDPDAVALSNLSGVDDSLIRRYLDGDVSIGLKNGPRLAKPLGLKPFALIAVAA
jgi:hypothetical protein